MMYTGRWLPGLRTIEELHLVESPDTPPLVEDTSNDTEEESFISRTMGMSLRFSSWDLSS